MSLTFADDVIDAIHEHIQRLPGHTVSRPADSADLRRDAAGCRGRGTLAARASCADGGESRDGGYAERITWPR